MVPPPRAPLGQVPMGREQYDSGTSAAFHAPSTTALKSTEGKGKVMDFRYLFSILGSPQRVPFNDLQYCLRIGYNLKPDDQERASWIMRHDRLKQWSTWPESLVLLINGNGDAVQRDSPITFFSAELLNALRDNPTVITLHFFCSVLHVDPGQVIPNDAEGLIKSLITQLLRKTTAWDVTFLNQRFHDKLEDSDLEALLRLFNRLIQQLPQDTHIFWVIDSISFLNKEPEFVTLIQGLMEIIKQNPDVAVKLLLTCCGRSRLANMFINDDDILDAPHYVPRDNQGWGQYAWNDFIGDHLRNIDIMQGGGDTGGQAY